MITIGCWLRPCIDGPPRLWTFSAGAGFQKGRSACLTQVDRLSASQRDALQDRAARRRELELAYDTHARLAAHNVALRGAAQALVSALQSGWRLMAEPEGIHSACQHQQHSTARPESVARQHLRNKHLLRCLARCGMLHNAVKTLPVMTRQGSPVRMGGGWEVAG